MQFKLPLIAVKDIQRSKTFYGELFDQTVAQDFGRNVVFSGGFAVQQDFAWLTSIEPETIVEKSNNMELYFEVDDFDAFMVKLKVYGSVEYVHGPLEHDWKQRVVRVYDPDGHMIEIGESMEIIIKKYLEEGVSMEEAADLTQHPMEFIQAVKVKYF